MRAQLTPFSQPERNPLTRKSHRREVFWQITLPAVVGGVVLLAIGVGVLVASVRGAGEVRQWADASLIFLLAPIMFIALILLILLIAMVYLLARAQHGLPLLAWRVQDFFTLIEIRSRQVADAAVEPFLRLHSWLAMLGALRRK